MKVRANPLINNDFFVSLRICFLTAYVHTYQQMNIETSGTKYTKFIYILYVRTHYEIKDDFLFFVLRTYGIWIRVLIFFSSINHSILISTRI